MIQHAFTASRKALTAERFQLENRLYQGCPTIACTKGGKIYAGWYSGGSKEPSLLNYNLLTVSGDGGKNWRELFVLEGCPIRKYRRWILKYSLILLRVSGYAGFSATGLFREMLPDI